MRFIAFIYLSVLGFYSSSAFSIIVLTREDNALKADSAAAKLLTENRALIFVATADGKFIEGVLCEYSRKPIVNIRNDIRRAKEILQAVDPKSDDYPQAEQEYRQTIVNLLKANFRPIAVLPQQTRKQFYRSVGGKLASSAEKLLHKDLVPAVQGALHNEAVLSDDVARAKIILDVSDFSEKVLKTFDDVRNSKKSGS